MTEKSIKGNRCQVSLYIDQEDLAAFDATANGLGDSRVALYRKLTKCFNKHRREFIEKFPELLEEEAK